MQDERGFPTCFPTCFKNAHIQFAHASKWHGPHGPTKELVFFKGLVKVFHLQLQSRQIIQCPPDICMTSSLFEGSEEKEKAFLLISLTLLPAQRIAL